MPVIPYHILVMLSVKTGSLLMLMSPTYFTHCQDTVYNISLDRNFNTPSWCTTFISLLILFLCFVQIVFRPYSNNHFTLCPLHRPCMPARLCPMPRASCSWGRQQQSLGGTSTMEELLSCGVVAASSAGVWGKVWRGAGVVRRCWQEMSRHKKGCYGVNEIMYTVCVCFIWMWRDVLLTCEMQVMIRMW